MAVSTALRNRYRLGEVAQLAAGNFRVLSDAVDVNENVLPAYVRILPGERIESIIDTDLSVFTQSPSSQDSLDVNDSIIVFKSKSPVLFDSLLVTDNNDVDVIISPSQINNRVIQEDAIEFTENFIKTITETDFFTIYIVKKEEKLSVTDTTQATFLGINQRTLSDSISVNDFDIPVNYLMRDDALDITDSDIQLRFVNHINAEYAAVTDDVIVTRNALARERTVTESFTVIDRAFATYVVYAPATAEIIIGIENQ